MVEGRKNRDPSTWLRAGFGTEGTREQGTEKQGPFDFTQGRLRDRSTSLGAGFGTKRTRVQGARQPGSDSDLCGLSVKADHGTILSRRGEMIGKLQRDQRSRVRGQKRNDLVAVWRKDLGGGGLTRSRPRIQRPQAPPRRRFNAAPAGRLAETRNFCSRTAPADTTAARSGTRALPRRSGGWLRRRPKGPRVR